MNNSELSDALSALELLQSHISSDNPINSQYIKRQTALLYRRKNILSKSECVEQLQSALENTIPYEIAIQRGPKYLTNAEIICIYNMACQSGLNTKNQYFELLIDICERYEADGTISTHLNIYELIMTAVASVFGNIGNYAYSNTISQKIIRESLHSRRMYMLHNNLYNIAWNNEMLGSQEIRRDNLIKSIVFSKMTKSSYYEEYYRNKLES